MFAKKNDILVNKFENIHYKELTLSDLLKDDAIRDGIKISILDSRHRLGIEAYRSLSQDLKEYVKRYLRKKSVSNKKIGNRSDKNSEITYNDRDIAKLLEKMDEDEQKEMCPYLCLQDPCGNGYELFETKILKSNNISEFVKTIADQKIREISGRENSSGDVFGNICRYIGAVSWGIDHVSPKLLASQIGFINSFKDSVYQMSGEFHKIYNVLKDEKYRKLLTRFIGYCVTDGFHKSLGFEMESVKAMLEFLGDDEPELSGKIKDAIDKYHKEEHKKLKEKEEKREKDRKELEKILAQMRK